MKKVIVTGANGFIGMRLTKKLLSKGFRVHGTVRHGKESLLPAGVKAEPIASIDGHADWRKILENVDAVVHLAARVHIMKESTSNSLAKYRNVNVLGSERLALAAAECGVKKFIFMSSVKVNGEESLSAYKENDTPIPNDAYAISKMDAESRIKEIAAGTDMDLVILRPPLVFGPGVKANFLELIRMIDKRIPLPLAKVNNRRSYIFLENLVDAVLACIKHPDAAGQTYFVSDDEDVSTTDLIRKIGLLLSKPARLFPFPKSLLFIIGRIIGKGSAVNRLTGSLTVDISKIKQELGWKPPFTMAYGLQKTAEWYKEKKELAK